jgi:ribonucleoside-diphosphate reductase alpha chain
MGFADMLFALRIPYSSEQAKRLAGDLMQYIADEARFASEELARERGEFPNWSQSRYAESGRRLRNATCTSIAPTGTIGIIAGTSPGIEPIFALAYRRKHVLEGKTLTEVNPLFERYARREGLLTTALVEELSTRGTLQDLGAVSQSAKKLFETALQIAPLDHLKIQAAFQKHVDNAVSKTINLPESATANQIAEIYRQAWEIGVKGVTVYRYGSKSGQVLNLGVDETPDEYEHFATCDPHACKL